MDKIRFAVIGSGWRSHFYFRTAQRLPQMLEPCSILVRSQEKARQFRRSYGVPAAWSLEELAGTCPHFVVVAVSKPDIFSVIQSCLDMGLAVLAETPPALELDQLQVLWRRVSREGCRLQVAEQYQFAPSYQAKHALVSQGLLGDITTVLMSDAHDYHGVSLIRRFLGAGLQNAVIQGESFSHAIAQTGSRQGLCRDGSVVLRDRDRFSFLFADGRRAFYDFSGEQYHSRIRSRHFAVQGLRGELFDNGVLWLDQRHNPQEGCLVYRKDGYNGVEQVLLGDQVLYECPYANPLPEEEAALAACLMGMGRYVETGEEFYPLADALQDAYFSLLMEQARRGGAVSSQDQPWRERH